MPAPADDVTHSTSGRPKTGRAVKIPSAELRYGPRLAVLHSSTTAQRAENVRDVVDEMVKPTAHEAGVITISELASCAAVSGAVAAYLDRMRRLPTSLGTPAAPAPRSRP